MAGAVCFFSRSGPHRLSQSSGIENPSTVDLAISAAWMGFWAWSKSVAHFGHSWQIKICFLHYSKQLYANSLQWFGSKSKHNEESTNPPSGSSGGSVESCPSYMSLFSLSLSLTCLHQYRNIHLYCKWVCVCVSMCVYLSHYILSAYFLLIFVYFNFWANFSNFTMYTTYTYTVCLYVISNAYEFLVKV